MRDSAAQVAGLIANLAKSLSLCSLGVWEHILSNGPVPGVDTSLIMGEGLTEESLDSNGEMETFE